MESISTTTAAPVSLARRDAQLVGSNQASGRDESVEEKNGATAVSVETANSAAQAFKSFVQDIQRNLDFSTRSTNTTY